MGAWDGQALVGRINEHGDGSASLAAIDRPSRKQAAPSLALLEPPYAGFAAILHSRFDGVP